MRPSLILLLSPFCLVSAVSAQQPAKPELPKVVLVGDSIRMGYAPLVARKLEGKAVVVSAKDNGGDSGNVLKNLEQWVIAEKPTLVHFNCGLHDLKLDRATKKHQVPLEQYTANLEAIVARLRKDTGAAVVFASTTPILDERHARRKASFDRFEADVKKYNEAAVGVMKKAGVPVHDLHWLVSGNNPETMLSDDGTHYTAAANERLAEAVADSVTRHLTIARYRPLAVPASGTKAAEDYRKDEKDRDALVPEVFKKMKFGQFKQPASADDWKKQRPSVLKAAVDSLGDLPERPAPQKVRVVSREVHPGFAAEKVFIDNGVDGQVSALLLVPEKRAAKAPAVLWLHSSTPDHVQVMIPGTNGGKTSLAEEFTRAGYVVLSPDAYWHGDRVGTGPSGTAETGRTEQESLFKYHLWMGRTLWGMFVRDDQVALDYLCGRPEVDSKRIGATGMSMGSTRAWWLAAVDERVTATVGVACLTRYQNLIAHGQLRQHGIYYFVNGLVKHYDTEGVIALIAPRPYLALTGDLDAGSPADGIKVIEREAGRVYATLGAREKFRSVLYPEVGHSYTPEMRREMLDWFARWLQPSASRPGRSTP